MVISWGSIVSFFSGFQWFSKNRIIEKNEEKNNCQNLKPFNYNENRWNKEKDVFPSKILFNEETSVQRKTDSNNNSGKARGGPGQYRPLIYHGGISRRLAEDVLYPQLTGSFLIRDSQTERFGQSLVLSVRSASGFLHLKIRRQSGQFVLGGRSPQFGDLVSLVSHYTRHSLRLRGGGRVRLYQPALERLLWPDIPLLPVIWNLFSIKYF